MKKTTRGVVAFSAALFALTFVGCSSKTESGVNPEKNKSVVGYYTFDEGVSDNEIKDHSPAKSDVVGNAFNGGETQAGVKGNALTFGGDEFIQLDNNVLSGDGFTFAAWVKSDSWKMWNRVFDIGGGDGTKDIFLAVDGRIAGTFTVYEQSSGAHVNAPLTPIRKWVHLAATFGNGKVALYVNGKLAEEADLDLSMKDIAEADGVYIGRSNWAADPLFKGAMDEIVVAKTVFSAEQIEELYKANASADTGSVNVADAKPFKLSDAKATATYYTFDDGVNPIDSVSGINSTTNATETTSGHSGNAIVLNGDEQFIELNKDLFASDGITISLWVNPTEFNDWSRIFDLGDQATDAWLGKDPAGKLRIDVNGPSGNISLVGELPQNGTWTHVAVTLGNDEAALYVNGKMAMNGGTELTPAVLAKTATGLYLGRSNWPDPYFNGKMDDVLIIQRALSEAEIASVFKGIEK